MLHAAARTNKGIRPSPFVSLALPIDAAYSRCARLFPGHSPELSLHYRFFLLLLSWKRKIQNSTNRFFIFI